MTTYLFINMKHCGKGIYMKLLALRISYLQQYAWNHFSIFETNYK